MITLTAFPKKNCQLSLYFDAATGLYNYNARLYNPSLGRFISADTIVPDPSNPQALNRYSYVINNPIMYTDPSGHDFWKHLMHEASRPQNAFIIQNLNLITGTYFLMQSQTGRQILVGEAIIGAAALGMAEFGVFDGTAGSSDAALAGTQGYWTDGGFVSVYSSSAPAATAPIDGELAITQLGTALGYGGIAYGSYEVGSAIASGLAGAGGRSGGGSSSSGGSSGGGGIVSSGGPSAWNNTVRGLDYFFSCVACNMAGPSMLDLVGPTAAGYYNYAAWNHAATTPSEAFGTSGLLYPARSSIYRGLMTNAGSAGAASALSI